MRYIQPQILRADNAARAIQHFNSQTIDKPFSTVLDALGTRKTDAAAYEADE